MLRVVVSVQGTTVSVPRIKHLRVPKDAYERRLSDVLAQTHAADDRFGESEDLALVATDKDKPGPVVTCCHA
jgi:hypothetical protein